MPNVSTQVNQSLHQWPQLANNGHKLHAQPLSTQPSPTRTQGRRPQSTNQQEARKAGRKQAHSLTRAPAGQAEPRVSVTTPTMASGFSGPHCSDPVPNRYPDAGGWQEGVVERSHGTCLGRMRPCRTRRPRAADTPATPEAPAPSIHTPGRSGDFVHFPVFVPSVSVVSAPMLRQSVRNGSVPVGDRAWSGDTRTTAR